MVGVGDWVGKGECMSELLDRWYWMVGGGKWMGQVELVSDRDLGHFCRAMGSCFCKLFFADQHGLFAFLHYFCYFLHSLPEFLAHNF